jgi:hypothetical protein
VKRTGCEAPHHAVFFSLVLLLPFMSIYSQHPFSNTLNLCPSFNVRNHVSHPYKTKGNGNNEPSGSIKGGEFLD